MRAAELLLAVDVVVPHTDADGLSSGALALRARGEAAADAVLLGRGQTPFGDDPPLPQGSAAVLDWGVRPLARPGLLVDHHAPEAEPRADQLVVSGYGEWPETTTAALVRRLVSEGPAWLAAVGAVGDLGDACFVLPECAGAPRTAVRRLVPLVNAPRRLPTVRSAKRSRSSSRAPRRAPRSRTRGSPSSRRHAPSGAPSSTASAGRRPTSATGSPWSASRRGRKSTR